MNRAASQRSKPGRWVSYPLAVQSVAVMALAATPISALQLPIPAGHLWALAGLCAASLLALALVPARRLPRWGQILFLTGQCASAVLAQTLAPAPLIGYVYLSIVLQAIVLFPLWLWIPYAVGVYALWSGLLALATARFLPWLESNLALAFPATCAIIAAIVYVRQQRRGEQAQQMLQQVQQHYDSLATGLRELQQSVMLEERRRLAQTIVGEVQAALSRTEQSLAQALAQAQTNLARLQGAVAQTRTAASATVERLRGAISTLRRGEPAALPTLSLATMLDPGEEGVIAGRARAVLTWVLPLVFVVLALGLILAQGSSTRNGLLIVLVCSLLLLLAYVGTQRTDNPFLLQAGLVGQSLAVLVMTLVSHTLPLLLGLLLVLWQLALRLPTRQIALYLAGVPTVAALLVARLSAVAPSFDALLVGAVAAVAVGGPLLLARRQFDRRKQAELRLALLSAEIEQQTAEVRALAVAAERSRLAREVHDDLGSQLMLISLQLQLAEELAGEDPGAALEQLQGSREQLHQAWRSALAVADAELPLAEADLGAALGGLVRQVGAARLTVEGELEGLAGPVAVTIYRSVQEGLTNARKHAQPNQVDVQVVALGGYVTVSVTNDPGPAEARSSGEDPGSGGFGLLGLRERAEALGGGIEAGRLADGGWRLRVVLPAEGSAMYG